MRTTLNIDETVLGDLRELADRNDLPFREAVDRALRAGIQSLRAPKKASPSRQRTFKMGQPLPGIDLNKALSLAGTLEDEEIVRKVAMRK